MSAGFVQILEFLKKFEKKKLQIFYHFSKATASAEALFFP